MTERTLVIHGGFAKTGTSALQVGFARNRDWLVGQGVDYLATGQYELGRRGTVGSGNAVDLAYHLCGLETRPETVAELLDALAASPSPQVLLSSEFFQSADPGRLRELVDAVGGAGFAVRAVFFVRAYYDWLWSAYVQNVKNHALTEPFSRWAPASGLAHMFAATVGTFDAVLGRDNVVLVNYDACGDALLPAFLRVAFDIEAGDADLGPSPRLNRSLTIPEIELMRRFNHLRHSEPDGALMGHLLIEANPAPTATRTFDHEVVKWLADEVADDLAALGGRVVGGALRLASVPVDGSGSRVVEPATTAMEALLLQTFGLLADTRRELEKLQRELAAPRPGA
jgi:hypothetical protein